MNGKRGSEHECHPSPPRMELVLCKSVFPRLSAGGGVGLPRAGHVPPRALAGT